MLVRIEGSDLPGREFGPACRNVHVAVQRRDRPTELLGPHPADVPSVAWELEVKATPVEGGWDLKGPYVQGRPGGRFVYLSWGTVDERAELTMFRRAKLWFDGIKPGTLAAAVEGGLLVGRLGLSDAQGNPLCAAVRPPLIEWSNA
ncbi:DUF5990 family protein [Streptomyces xanthochromogenes]|uniref:DUF5990 family protein n=1 Tax=Streptomyces xanthochromogenes TaxID=67384 RepID=UPI00341D1363